MVYFDHHAVLPPETQERVDKLIEILGALQSKLPDLSAPIDTAAATNALNSIERAFANTDPILRSIDCLIVAVQALASIVKVFIFCLGFSVGIGLTLCYLVWKNGHVAKVSINCQCDRKAEKKLE
jgi:hypothetical protein